MRTKIAKEIPQAALCRHLLQMQVTKNALDFSPAKQARGVDPAVHKSASVIESTPNLNELICKISSTDCSQSICECSIFFKGGC